MEGTDQTLWWNRVEPEHGGITFWRWLIVSAGLLLDVSAQAQAYTQPAAGNVGLLAVGRLKNSLVHVEARDA